jgi:hypothetical protein
MIDYAAPTLPTQSVPLVRGGADRVAGDAISLIAQRPNSSCIIASPY